MKFTIDRTTLLKTLSHTQSVVEKRKTIPVLANILLETDADSLRLTATDMELTITDRISIASPLPGRVTAPAGTLYDIAKRLPDGADVLFDYEAGGETLKIKAGKFKTDLQILPADDFPEMTKGELPYRFELPCTVLRQALERVRFAMSTEETRYYLNGIYLHVPDGGDRIMVVATDGHRLAKVPVDAPDSAKLMPGIILPRKAVAELLRLLGESEGTVALALSSEKLQATLGDMTLTSRLIDGTFPDYEHVIPHDNHKVMRIETAALASAVDRCATISTDRDKPIKFELGTNTLLVIGQGDRGQAQEELTSDVVRHDGEALSIGFKTKYVKDLLEQMGEYTEVRMKDSASPTLFSDPGDSEGLFLLMPMRV